MEKNIVKVKYEDNFCPRTFLGKEYTYFTSIAVNKGDLVKAPTKYGIKIAKIIEINVSQDEIKGIKQYMKTITTKINKNRYINFFEVVEEAT